jgi:hypothetical protein
LKSFDPQIEAFVTESKPAKRLADVEQQTRRILIYIGSLLNSSLRIPPLEGTALNRPADDHPGVPAGYTYLYQFAAHDMTHTAVVPRPIGDFDLADVDMRRQPLALDTLFGGGPSACRHAYDTGKGNGDFPLRLGVFRESKRESPRVGPARDLPRCAFAENQVPDEKATLTEVLIADPRNDDNNLLAQMTVLFSRLYNVLMAGTAPQTEEEVPVPNRHRAQLAREATIRVYRRILRKDLTWRIMQRDVWEHFNSTGAAILQTRMDSAVSREFRSAASRLAHSMVRPHYALNAESRSVDLERILLTSSLHAAWRVPTPRKWMIDWRYFFPTGAGDVPEEDFNWALKFGPYFGLGMGAQSAAAAPEPCYPHGVMMLDLLRDNLTHTEDVAQLLQRLSDANLEFRGLAELQDADYRRRLVADGLAALEANVAPSVREPFFDEDREKLIEHPPLLLFLMFEAQALGNGLTHGPLGSVLVGDAFLPVFKAGNGMNFGSYARTLEEKVLDGTVDCMADLIRKLDAADPVGAE